MSVARAAHPFSQGGRAKAFDADAFGDRLRAPRERETFRFAAREVPEDFRRSGVLIPMWREGDEVRVLLTRRAARMRTQPGQMSFPGGRLEGAEDWIEGALRETHEEVGIPPERIRILGTLDDAWSGARHHIVPVVGWLESRPEIVASAAEVDAVFTPTVASLIRPEVYVQEPVTIDDREFHNATIDWGEAHVFGLTTDLLIEALQWGLGVSNRAGEERLASLRAWLRAQASDR